MAKAVLVLDNMPEKCTDCKFVIMEHAMICCNAAGGRAVVFSSKPKWCPLKEYSEEIITYDVTTQRYIGKGKQDGKLSGEEIMLEDWRQDK